MDSWDTSLPSPLRELNTLEFDYADGEGIDFEPFSAFLSARETFSWFRDWTGNENADGAAFRVFGQDGTGGYAAFWLVDLSKEILEQPVIFLGSEGETGVLAVNFDEYLWLPAAGVGPYEAVAYPELEREPNALFTAFAKEHSSVSALSPQEIVANGRKASLDLMRWIESLCR